MRESVKKVFINDRFYKGFHSTAKMPPKDIINDKVYKGFVHTAHWVLGNVINIMVFNGFYHTFPPTAEELCSK